MQIEWACTKLSHDFAYFIDNRDYDSLAALFAPDGVWERHGVRLNGREEILKTMKSRPSNQFTRHITTSFHFSEVAPTVARATLYNMSYFSFTVEKLPSAYVPENAILLDFFDTYKLTDEGWRLAERITPAVFVAPSLLHR
jgi:hypothetical protein